MATAWGQRRSLGKKYAVDPALTYELERLQQQYALAPGRESRALQASQFGQSLATTKEQNANSLALSREQLAAQTEMQNKTLAQNQAQFNATQAYNQDALAAQEKAGMIGTVGNTMMTGSMLYGMTLKPGEPFIPYGAKYDAWKAAQAGGDLMTTPDISSPIMSSPAPATNINPSWIDSTATGMEAAGAETLGYAANVAPTAASATLPEGMLAASTEFAGAEGAAGLSGAAASGATEGGGMLASVTPYFGPAAAGYMAPGLLDTIHKDSTENLGHNLTFGLVRGEKAAGAVGSTATGAAAGAAVGSIVPGIGTAIGAAVGAVFGAVSSVVKDSSWLCTEIASTVGLTKSDLSLLLAFRRYTVREQNTWLTRYLERGDKLVAVINATVPDREEFYRKLKSEMLDPILALIADKKMLEAYEKYKEDTLALCEKYAPELISDLKAEE